MDVIDIFSPSKIKEEEDRLEIAAFDSTQRHMRQSEDKTSEQLDSFFEYVKDALTIISDRFQLIEARIEEQDSKINQTNRDVRDVSSSIDSLNSSIGKLTTTLASIITANDYKKEVEKPGRRSRRNG